MNTPGLPKTPTAEGPQTQLRKSVAAAIANRAPNRFDLMEELKGQPEELAVALHFELQIQQSEVGRRSSLSPGEVATNLDAMVDDLEAREAALVEKLVDLVDRDRGAGSRLTVKQLADKAGVSVETARTALVRGLSLELAKGQLWPNLSLEKLGLGADQKLIYAARTEAARARLEAYPESRSKYDLFDKLENDYQAGRITRQQLVPLAAPLLEELLQKAWTSDYPIIQRLTELAREGGVSEDTLKTWFEGAARTRLEALAGDGPVQHAAEDARTLLAAKTPKEEVRKLLQDGYLHLVASEGEGSKKAAQLKADVGDLMGTLSPGELETKKAAFAEQQAAKTRRRVLSYVDNPSLFSENDLPDLVKLFDEDQVGIEDFTSAITAVVNWNKWGVMGRDGQELFYARFAAEVRAQVGDRIDWSGVWESKHCRSNGVDVYTDLQDLARYPIDDDALDFMRDRLARLLPIGDDVEPKEIRVALDHFRKEYVDSGRVQSFLERHQIKRDQAVIVSLFDQLQSVLASLVPGLTES
jgi:hypothetical protein